MNYKISDLAKILGVTTNTIRRYEKNKYTEPVRNGANYRQYLENDIYKLAIIRLCRKYGFSHEEIEIMLESSEEKTEELFRKRLDATNKQIEKLFRIREWLEASMEDMKTYSENKDRFFITEQRELKYVLFTDGVTFLREEERLSIINRFMYDAPQVLMLQFWQLQDILSGSFSAPPGAWGISKEYFESLDPEIKNSKYIKTYPGGRFFAGIMKKHPKNYGPDERHTQIACDYFKTALSEMKNNGLKPCGSCLGVIQNSLSPDAGVMVYIPLSIFA